MINWHDTVISQYANSPIIMALLESFNDWVDPEADFDLFYRQVWDIDTATGYGLDVWGRIVGVDRVLAVPSTPKYFGFFDGAGSYAPFNNGPFNAGGSFTQNYVLSDDAYRTLVLIKAAANISDCSASSINVLMTALFGQRGRTYVADLGSMQMSYNFEFFLQPFELTILQSAGVLPRPTGVQISINETVTTDLFGFKEAGPTSLPFNVGIFSSHPIP